MKRDVYVGETINNVVTTPSSGTKTYTIENWTSTVGNNTGATKPTFTDNTLYCTQAGTLTLRIAQEAETNGFNAGGSTINIEIKKRPNPMTCSWGSWSKNVNFDSHTAVTFTSANTEAGAPAVTISKVSGGAVADYNSSTKKIDANHRDGTVIWEIEQVENYKYVRAYEKCTVNVGTVSAPDCDILLYSSDPDKEASKISAITLNGLGVAMTFDIKYKGAGGKVKVKRTYNNGNSDETEYTATAFADYTNRSITLGANVSKVEFVKKGTDDPYINTIRVMRKKYFDIENKAGSAITEMTMPLNIHGGVVKRDTFYIDYSTCEGTIKLENHHPRIKFAATNSNSYSFSTVTAHHDRPAIALTYTSPANDAENITDTIYIYTPSDYKKLIIHAQSKGKLQTMLHYIGNASYTTDAKNIAATALFEVRDENNDLVANPVITLGTGTTSNVTLANDNKSIASLCGNSNDGTPGNITAYYAGDGAYEAATNNVLSQNFTINRLKDEVSFDSGYESMVVGEEIDLTEWATSCTSGTDIIVTSVFKDYIVIEDGKVKAVAKGNGRLRAASAGDCTYNSGVKFLNIAVRNPEDPCESSLLYSSKLIKVGAYSHPSSNPVTYTIPDGPQDKLTFKVWKVYAATQEATLQILDKNNNVLTNGTINYGVGSLSDSEPDAPNKEINMADYPGAKKLRFYGGGTLNKYFSEVRISQKAYLTASTSSVTMSTVQACDTAKGQFTVDYSDVSHIQLSQTNNDFSYEIWDGETKLIGFENGCKSYGTYTVKFCYVPQAKGPYSNTVTISASGKSQTITLNGTATKPDREIVWDIPTGNTITATQSLDLTAYAETSCQSPAGSVYYTASPADAVTIDGNHITFKKAATVTVTAHTVASDDYNDALPVDKVWTVGKIGTQMRTLPTITSTITYGDNSSVVTYDNNSWVAEDTLNHEVVTGIIVYNGPASFDAAGLQDLTFYFYPTVNAQTYDVCLFTVPVNVQKLETLNVPVALSFCAGESETFHGKTYTTAGTDQINAVGATRDTVYNVTVTVLQPTTGTDSKTITVGDNESWHEIDLSGYVVGSHEVEYHTTNVAGCDSTVTLSLTVNKIETLNVPVALSFCAGESETFHGETYTTAGTDQINAVGATRDTVYNVTVTVLQPTTGTDSKTIVCGASESWNGIDLSGYAVGSHSVEAVLTNAVGCDSTVTLTLTVSAPFNEFTNAAGDGDWQNPANWTSVPTGSEPNVIVSGALEIDENVTVGNLTIENTGSIAVITGGTLTVKGTSEDRSEYGDVHVLNDGAIHLGSSADLQVRHFTLDAKLGDADNAAASGQVDSVSNLHVNGDAYFKMSFDVTGQITYGWYDFVVPFEVDALNGVFAENGTPVIYGTDYIIMSHSEEMRARNQKAWNTFTGTLEPGRIYTITFEETKIWNTFLFKKKAGSELANSGTYTSDYSSAIGEAQDRGWNGFGNGTLQHRELTDLSGISKVQMYNHTWNRYDVIDDAEWNTKALAVGTAFSIQVGSVQPVVLVEADAEKPLRAPRMDARMVDEFCLTLTVESADRYADRLWVSASEEATGEYVIGRDLLKMGTPTSAKVAQMWTVNNGLNLCDIEMPLVGNNASTPLNLYAPQAGTYEIAVEKSPADATLYLTKNGRVVWNLSMSPYTIDLTKGTTSGYGLRIVADRQTTTDVENSEIENQSVRKVLIDDKIYIVTPDGKMYDIVGKSVKY